MPGARATSTGSTPVGGLVKSGQRWTKEEGRGLDKRLVWLELVTTWIQRQGQCALIPCIGSGQGDALIPCIGSGQGDALLLLLLPLYLCLIILLLPQIMLKIYYLLMNSHIELYWMQILFSLRRCRASTSGKTSNAIDAIH